MTLLDQVVEVLAEDRKAMHVNDISSAILARRPNDHESVEQLAGKISSVLSSHLRSKKSQARVAKLKNKQGGYKRGMYRLRIRRPKIAKKFAVPEQPRTSTQFTGRAGEFSVMSELLFFGFNASVMTVDDGIDIVASKDSSYFHIQVKTANVSPTGKFRFHITQRAFEAKNAATTFYIFVMRTFGNSRYGCDHLILPSSEINRLLANSIIRDNKSITFSVSKERNGRLLLNGTEEVTWALNRYDTIL